MISSLSLAKTIIDDLIGLGIRNFVISPGSRNVPLSLAVMNRESEINSWARVDERSAGFFALGLALKTQFPTVLIVTSGTAVANLFPAIIEASYSQVPLIVLTADRPELQVRAGSSQTLPQLGMYGVFPRKAVTLTAVMLENEGKATFSEEILELLQYSLGDKGEASGPVQINVELEPPLVSKEWASTATKKQSNFKQISIEEKKSTISVDLALSTVVIAGYNSGSFPELSNLPTVAEPESEQKGIPISPLLLNNLPIEQVIVCGRPTLHRQVNQLLNKPGINLIHLGKYPEWLKNHTDYRNVYNQVLIQNKPNEVWINSVAELQNSWLQKLENWLENPLDNAKAVLGLQIAAKLGNKVRAEDNLILAASNTIRDVALAATLPARLNVYANRGVAGIDGFVSTALGIASGDTDLTKVNLAMVGDLSFLYDINGFLFDKTLETVPNLIYLVLNDNGGGIFKTLEYGQEELQSAVYQKAYNKVIKTSTNVNIAALATAFGIKYKQVNFSAWQECTREDLANFKGIWIWEINIESNDLYNNHAQLRELADKLRINV